MRSNNFCIYPVSRNRYEPYRSRHLFSQPDELTTGTLHENEQAQPDNELVTSFMTLKSLSDNNSSCQTAAEHKDMERDNFNEIG